VFIQVGSYHNLIMIDQTQQFRHRHDNRQELHEDNLAIAIASLEIESRISVFKRQNKSIYRTPWTLFRASRALKTRQRLVQKKTCKKDIETAGQRKSAITNALARVGLKQGAMPDNINPETTPSCSLPFNLLHEFES
jgi:hypothetical protein